ncbi:aminotransferase class I/II-fold pyridoxal phosphate-dependent enzyme [Kitasatospora sp. NPDC093558]|uniref:aminotransferase class I/II-fold pyridoxal phosphate-dependent enzyme n=1 Tax=Kitasatospora sp. NPDC093558 TaxID=3155201 RepID=UPI00343437AF
MDAPLFQMLQRHETLEAERQRPGGRLFISDYNGGHPYVERYLGELAHTSPHRLGDVTRYAALDEDTALREKIAEMHRRYDGVGCTAERVVPAGGSSGLLGTFCTWLTLSGFKRVHYLPPVYYKLAYWFREFGIEPVKVAEQHAYQGQLDLRLPDERSVLILTDPVWYTGRRVPVRVLEAIGDWQRETGSLVFVDGTFQYMRWDGQLREDSAALPADRTFRLVCPTKYLSIHGYRCAHLLAPAHLRERLAELHLNLHGDATVADRLFAHRAADLMLGEGNNALLRHVRDNHRLLHDSGALTAQAPIETGYFLFARTRVPHENFLALDENYFELHGYPGYVRINLLNPAAIEGLLRTAAADGSRS